MAAPNRWVKGALSSSGQTRTVNLLRTEDLELVEGVVLGVEVEAVKKENVGTGIWKVKVFVQQLVA